MPFIQLIEFTTSRWDEVQALLQQYRKDTAGSRTAVRTTVCVDRQTPHRYVAIVEFPSYEAAMENSNLPETAAMADAMAALCDGPPVFRNLDVAGVLED
jgi:quinol monooxygenase YgiN